MAKATIVCVNINGDVARVAYATGTEKTYPIDKLPKTVQAWMDESKREPDPEPEKIDLNDDSQTAYIDLYATWYEPQPEEDPDPEPEPGRSDDEAVEIILPSIIENPEYHDTPIPPRELEDPPKDLPTPSQGSPNPGTCRRASEAVAFGICLAFAILAHGLIEMVSLLAIMIETGWALAKPRARAGVRWIRETGWPMAVSGSKMAAKVAAATIWYMWIVIA